MKNIVKYLVIIFLLFYVSTTNAQEIWKLVKNSDNIKVYTREVEGSNMDEFKAVAIIDAKIEVIGVLLRDIPANALWMSGCIKSYMIKEIDEFNSFVYFEQEAPWPVDNRDVVLSVNTDIDYKKGEVIITMVAVKDKLVKINSDIVRMTKVNSMFIFNYISRNKTKVTYSSHADPGGYIPAAIINSMSENIPYKTMMGMKKMLKKQKYITAGENSNDKKLVEKAISEGYLIE